MILEQGHRIWRVICRLRIFMFIFGRRQNWVGGCLLFCIRDGPGICDMFGGVSLLLAFWVLSLMGTLSWLGPVTWCYFMIEFAHTSFRWDLELCIYSAYILVQLNHYHHPVTFC